MLNKAYLNAGHNATSDECMTPYYAVDPLAKYIPKGKTIWCPFDKAWSAFVQILKKDNIVLYSHIDEGQDFFKYQPDDFDVIISNPPFSVKDQVLERCYTLGKPFALLLPVNSIQGKKRVSLFKKHDLELLVFDGRIDFHTRGNFVETSKNTHFGSAYFCRGILPKPIIFESLEKYEKPLV